MHCSCDPLVDWSDAARRHRRPELSLGREEADIWEAALRNRHQSCLDGASEKGVSLREGDRASNLAIAPAHRAGSGTHDPSPLQKGCSWHDPKADLVRRRDRNLDFGVGKYGKAHACNQGRQRRTAIRREL